MVLRNKGTQVQFFRSVFSDVGDESWGALYVLKGGKRDYLVIVGFACTECKQLGTRRTT